MKPNQYNVLSSHFPLVSLSNLASIIGYDRVYLKNIASKAGRYYDPFDIFKCRVNDRDTWRHIDNPKDELKHIQRKILKNILSTVRLPDGIIGGVEGKSIIDNAKQHIGKSMLVTLDLKNCFPRINNDKVFDVYCKVFGCSDENASILTRLTTFQRRLPQGAPTSPMLANLTLLPLYNEMSLVLQNKNLTWTFYIDDIAISGTDAHLYIGTIIDLIHKYGHGVSHKKKEIMPHNIHQEVTGIVTNTKPSISKDEIEIIRNKILELSNKSALYSYELNSIKGSIAHIKRFCLVRGTALDELCKRLLPQVVIPGKKPMTLRIRKCKSTRCHILKNAIKSV